MALFALVFIFGFALFNFGSVTPSSGEADEVWSSKGSGSAILLLKSTNPLVVDGKGFKPAERVRISGAGTRTVTSTRRGRFTARMGGFECGSLTLVARGSAGSRASLNYSNVAC